MLHFELVSVLQRNRIYIHMYVMDVSAQQSANLSFLVFLSVHALNGLDGAHLHW